MKFYDRASVYFSGDEIRVYGDNGNFVVDYEDYDSVPFAYFKIRRRSEESMMNDNGAYDISGDDYSWIRPQLEGLDLSGGYNFICGVGKCSTHTDLQEALYKNGYTIVGGFSVSCRGRLWYDRRCMSFWYRLPNSDRMRSICKDLKRCYSLYGKDIDINDFTLYGYDGDYSDENSFAFSCKISEYIDKGGIRFGIGHGDYDFVKDYEDGGSVYDDPMYRGVVPGWGYYGKLNESSRDNLLTRYVELLNSRGKNVTLSQVKQYLLAKFVNEAHIRNLSLESNYYLAGVARYYFNGDLTTNKVLNAFDSRVNDRFDEEICNRLSALIMVLRNSYIDSIGEKFEQPEDFGELSLKKLLRKYGKEIDKELGVVKGNNADSEYDETEYKNDSVGNGYTYEILYSYEDARKYKKYTEPGAWCITYGEQHYNGYIRREKIHYVIFKKDGFENVKRVPEEKKWIRNYGSLYKPQDTYGNSLIALLQSNTDGEPVFITSRWNHGYSDCGRVEADHAYTKEEFEKITGVSDADLQKIFEIWKNNARKKGNSRTELNKKRTKVLRVLKYAQIKINGGNYVDAFDKEFSFKELLYLNLTEKYREKIKSEVAKYTSSGMTMPIAEQYKFTKNLAKACSIRVDDKIYYFMIDKNKILFETLAEHENWDDASCHFYSSNIYDNGYNNIVICKVINGYMLYDLRMHSFVEIDGIKKFKKIHNRLNIVGSKQGFYIVSMSTAQKALVDLSTNKPLVLPNGSSWFENVKTEYYGHNSYYDDKHGFLSNNNSRLLSIVYDSSSGEKYFYDMSKRQFININIPFEAESIEPLQDTLKLPSGFLFLRCLIHNKIGNYVFRNVLLKDGEPLYIRGNFNFVDVKGLNNGYLLLRCDGGKVLIYNVNTNEIIEVPDIGNGNYTFFRTLDDGSAEIFNSISNLYIYFLSNTGCFLRNPTNNGFIFKLKPFNYYHHNNKLNLLNIYDEANNEYVEYKFNDETNELERVENINVNESAIKNAILSSFLKLLN